MFPSFLSIWDYVVICAALALSSGYGLYYGCYQKQSGGSGTLEYMLASRNMKMTPVALSYFATIASTGVIIGYPNEVYAFGFQVILVVFTVVPCTFIVNHVFFPIYRQLESASLYEYLEVRFSTTLKQLVTIFTVFQAVALSSAQVYGPSTVLSRVTGLNTWYIVGALSALCIIYTTLGGIRAVILADVVQAILIFVSMVVLLVAGIVYVGGVSVVFRNNYETERLDILNFDLDLTARQTVWSCLIGYFFTFLSLTATSQFSIQRFMTTKSIEVSQRANILGNVLFSLVLVLSMALGLVAYATFHGCDPLNAGSIQNMDQLLPAYIMKILTVPLLPGLIFTGILCASLSTLSSVYNSAATVVMITFVKPLYPMMTDSTSALICKILVVVVGILSVLGVLVAERFPNVVQSAVAILSSVGAPLLGLLLIGILFPQANIRVASVSFLFSVVVMIWIIAGTLLQTTPLVPKKPLTVVKCSPLNSLQTLNVHFVSTNETVLPLRRDDHMADNWNSYFPFSNVSFMWYAAIGTLTTFLTFVILSLVVDGLDLYSDVRLLNDVRIKMSKFDHIVRVMSMSKFFTKGWGDPEAFKRLMEFRPVILDRDRCHRCVPKDYPVTIDKTESHSDYDVVEGHFRSPFVDHVPGVVPEESENAYFQMILPKKWRSRLKPICLHLAGTGDHYFWRRRSLLAKPLVREASIGSIILENPFYGLRKPKLQTGSNLHNVTDIFVKGGCLALESTVLFHWCERQGYGPLGVTGISMGGHMASVAACVWPKPIALIPCLSWTTASCVFTQGVMSGAIQWDLLDNQVFSNCFYRDELRNILSDLKDDAAFEAGKRFLTKYAETVLNNLSGDNGSGGTRVQDLGGRIAAVVGPLSSREKDSHAAALHFMRGIMDEFTHLGGFSRPVDSSLIVVVVAKDDGYVLRDGIVDLREIWPLAEVRYVDAGHISAFLFKQSVFRKAIVDAFDRIARKYYTHLL